MIGIHRQFFGNTTFQMQLEVTGVGDKKPGRGPKKSTKTKKDSESMTQESAAKKE